jgi:hypothetical protein
MDQRIYYGNINPHALADHLVSTFHRQPPFYSSQHHTMAQKIAQGERVLVQIMHTSSDLFESGHKAIGVNIISIPGGVRVEMGATDWLNLNEAGVIGLLLGVFFFPPLLLFPLIQTLTNIGFPQDIWNVIETYCVQANGGRRGSSYTPQGFYCTYCGAFNHPSASHCHYCKAPFKAAPPPQPNAQPTAEASTPTPPAQESQPLVTCPNCQASVVPARFCGNCAAPLEKKSGKEGGNE